MAAHKVAPAFARAPIAAVALAEAGRPGRPLTATGPDKGTRSSTRRAGTSIFFRKSRAAVLSSRSSNAASYGEAQPVTNNDSQDGKSSNRRIAIVIVPDISGLPGFDELNRLSAGQ